MNALFNATAKPRAGVTPQIASRWVPRFVWTLHRVPGRLNGPPLAVRRRVIDDNDDIITVETPYCSTSCDRDALETEGKVRAYGTHRWSFGKPPPETTGVWPMNIAVVVYDHEPTEQERIEWLAIDIRLHALLKRLIDGSAVKAWLVAADGASGKPHQARATKIRLARAAGEWGDCVDRYTLQFRDGRSWEFCGKLSTLVEKGRVRAHFNDVVEDKETGNHITLDRPSNSYLVELGRKFADEVKADREENERLEKGAREFINFMHHGILPEATA